jgi:ribosomal subunit interface protein
LVHVTYRHLPPSPSLTAFVENKAAELGKFVDHIVECRVVVEALHPHHDGKHFRVHVTLQIPGASLVADRDEEEVRGFDAYHAVTASFRAIERQLHGHMRRVERLVKQHAEPTCGRVSKLFQAESYGFIATDDAREIYFHEHSVLNERFGQLQLGDEVRFLEEAGEEGPQASTVYRLAARPAHLSPPS